MQRLIEFVVQAMLTDGKINMLATVELRYVSELFGSAE